MAKKNRTFSFGEGHWDRLTALSVRFFKREDQRTLVLEKLIDQAFEPHIAGRVKQATKDVLSDPDKSKAAKVVLPDMRSRVDPDKIDAAQRRMAQNMRKR